MDYLTPDDYKRAEGNGINKKAVYSRFYVYGWTKERTITEPLYSKDNPNTKYPKKYYDQAKKNGIKLDTFRKRVSSGMSLEEASTKPLERKGYPKRIVQLRKEHNIPFTTFLYRIRRGMDMEEAATMPPMTKAEAAKAGFKNKLA